MWRFFVDEAGNTGPDYCNPDQPVFVAAGFLVAPDAVSGCEAVIADASRTLARTTHRSIPEIKSSSLIGSARGRVSLADTLDALRAAGAEPLFSAIDKHFSLGARFVDDYLDPASNPRGGPEFCINRDVMRAAATSIGTLSLPTLKSVELALRFRSIQMRRDAVRSVAAELRGRNESELADRVEGALMDLAGPKIEVHSRYEWPDPVKAETPNVAAFSILLMNLDARAERQRTGTVTLVHDEMEPLRESFLHAYRLLSSDDAFEAIFDHPLVLTPRKVEFVGQPVYGDSRESPMLQAADLFAGAIAHWIKQAFRRERFDEATRRLACFTLEAFHEADQRYGGFVFSEEGRWIRWMARQVGKDRVNAVFGAA